MTPPPTPDNRISELTRILKYENRRAMNRKQVARAKAAATVRAQNWKIEHGMVLDALYSSPSETFRNVLLGEFAE
jgi:hypothetical protein